jgi:GNAT superfamily N-acetyltransferase
VEIQQLDVTDHHARRAWYAAMEASIRPDRPHALLESYDAFEVAATAPSAYYDRSRWQAVEDGHVVGVAELELPLNENLDVGWCEINVLPDHRRKGVGSALWDTIVARARQGGRSRLGGEVSLDPAGPQAGLAFAASVGAGEKHLEHHLIATLPLPPTAIDDAYDLVAWRGRCPDEHREAYLAMRNQMNTDVPTGELDLEAEVLDDERLASSEARLAASYDVRVAAARRRSDGTFGGYSLLFVPHGADYAWQDDTLVMPEHRGHRLGAALKSANYADLPPTITLVHTWTAPSNTAMHHTNTALGFRVVEHMYEVEAVIA